LPEACLPWKPRADIVTTGWPVPRSQAIECLAAIQAAQPVRRKALSAEAQKRRSAEAQKLRYARVCYDHLAGRLGVAVTQGLIERGFLAVAPEKRFDVTPAGVAWFAGVGLDVTALKPARRGLARPCLDWTKRTHHLAGPLGAQSMSLLCERGWLRRSKDSRAVRITPEGCMEMKRHLGVDYYAL